MDYDAYVIAEVYDKARALLPTSQRKDPKPPSLMGAA